MWLPFLFLYERILHGHQLGDYFPNQVASSKILGALATKMVTTWRVVTIRLDKVYILLVILTGQNNNNNNNNTTTTNISRYITRGHASFFTLFFLSGLCQLLQSNLDYSDFDYPDFSIIWTFSLAPIWSWIFSHILFKTTALKSEVKYEVFLLSKSKSSARVCCN